MIKRSLRLKVSLLLFSAMILLLLTGLLFNTFFSERYYLKSRMNNLTDTFEQLESILKDESLVYDSEKYYRVEEIEEKSSSSVIIFSMDRFSFEYPVDLNGDNGFARENRAEKNKRIKSVLLEYMLGFPVSEYGPELIKARKDTYGIYKFHDTDNGVDYIDLVGFLKNNDIVLIRMNYDNISENAMNANFLFGISGLIVAVIGGIGIYFFSRSIEKPITNLANITDEMSKLNFSSRYEGTRSDEIGVLGRNVNKMSDRLEKTINELKTANMELEKDIADKNEIDKMRREFISNISHELKTPIALIQGYAEGLADNVNDDAESRNFYCEVIMDEALKMNKMVKRLMNLSELELGNSKVQLERFDLTELIKEVCISFDIISKQKGVSLIFEQNEPKFLWADRYMIEEVITNYLSNAFNYVSGSNVIEVRLTEAAMADDGVEEINIRTDNGNMANSVNVANNVNMVNSVNDANNENAVSNVNMVHNVDAVKNGNIRVSVFNTGEQIPAESLPLLWDKFYKVDKARTREYGGSGIGLSIVKAIIELHHGSYGARNFENGVEFWIEIPTNNKE